MTEKQQQPKCRVQWRKPYTAGTVCNYVDERTNECSQEDINHCPCGGIVRIPMFKNARTVPDAITLTPTLTQHYAERSQATGKPVPALVLQDLEALHRKRVAREERRGWKEIEMERLCRDTKTCGAWLAEHDAHVAAKEREEIMVVVDQIRATAREMLNPPLGCFTSQERFRKDCLEEIDMNVRTLRQLEQPK